LRFPKSPANEKTMATLAHVLQCRLVHRSAYSLSRQARFGVRCFSRYAGFIVATYPDGSLARRHDCLVRHDIFVPCSRLLLGFFLGFAILWLAVIGIMDLNLLIAIFYGVNAARGEWADYPSSAVGPDVL
jgi:hypothetical protein